MDKWEYLALKIEWNDKEQKFEGWLKGSVMKAEYIHELFGPLGGDGWELVSFFPDSTGATSSGYMGNITAWVSMTYRAIFKRKLP